MRVDRIASHRQQGEQGFVRCARANHDEVRVRCLQLRQIAAVAVGNEHALHAVHFAIERKAHLASVVKMPAAFIVAAAVLHV